VPVTRRVPTRPSMAPSSRKEAKKKCHRIAIPGEIWPRVSLQWVVRWLQESTVDRSFPRYESRTESHWKHCLGRRGCHTPNGRLLRRQRKWRCARYAKQISLIWPTGHRVAIPDEIWPRFSRPYSSCRVLLPMTFRAAATCAFIMGITVWPPRSVSTWWHFFGDDDWESATARSAICAEILLHCARFRSRCRRAPSHAQ
jgi:hypothetical protein